ncbi:hypothetical protein [Arthrobacter sp. NPDC058127]
MTSSRVTSFLVRHRSPKARAKDGHASCVECEG